MSILARIGLRKAQSVGRAITDAIIKLDPDTATDAQIDELDAQFRDLSFQLAQSEQALNREEQEAVAAQTTFERKKKAAQILQRQADEATDAGKKAQLESSLDKLLDELEGMKADVDREKQEAEDAKALRDQLQETTKAMADNLKQVRGALTQAKRRMQQAEAKEAAAVKSAEVAEQLAGIKKTGSKFNTVLTALDEAAAQHEAAASAATARANLLRPASEGDANIEAALREAEGAPPKADRTARLAAL